jgi:hypothetical protein
MSSHVADQLTQTFNSTTSNRLSATLQYMLNSHPSITLYKEAHLHDIQLRHLQAHEPVEACRGHTHCLVCHCNEASGLLGHDCSWQCGPKRTKLGLMLIKC